MLEYHKVAHDFLRRELSQDLQAQLDLVNQSSPSYKISVMANLVSNFKRSAKAVLSRRSATVSLNNSDNISIGEKKVVDGILAKLFQQDWGDRAEKKEQDIAIKTQATNLLKTETDPLKRKVLQSIISHYPGVIVTKTNGWMGMDEDELEEGLEVPPDTIDDEPLPPTPRDIYLGEYDKNTDFPKTGEECLPLTPLERREMERLRILREKKQTNPGPEISLRELIEIKKINPDILGFENGQRLDYDEERFDQLQELLIIYETINEYLKIIKELEEQQDTEEIPGLIEVIQGIFTDEEVLQQKDKYGLIEEFRNILKEENFYQNLAELEDKYLEKEELPPIPTDKKPTDQTLSHQEDDKEEPLPPLPPGVKPISHQADNEMEEPLPDLPTGATKVHTARPLQTPREAQRTG